jgi:hypothetical protein
VSGVTNAQVLSSKRGALAEDSMELSKAGNYADFILYARLWFHRERLIACNPRPGIADVRLIDPKGRGLQKQNKKSPLRGSKHHETKLRSPRDRFSPAVRIELGENGGDVKLGGVKRDSQSTCDRFVGGAVCHCCKDFKLAGR